MGTRLGSARLDKAGDSWHAYLCACSEHMKGVVPYGAIAVSDRVLSGAGLSSVPIERITYGGINRWIESGSCDRSSGILT